MDHINVSNKPLRILSLDGGGIRGVSSLLILESIMQEICKEERLGSVSMRPCDYFDLIGGTSTGGIIAIMLGRLRMTVEECIRAYEKVSRQAFTPRRTAFLPAPPSGSFSAKHLESAIKQTIQDHCLDPNCATMRRESVASTASAKSTSSKASKGSTTSSHGGCPHEDALLYDSSCTKTAILSITKANVDVPPTLFTTYGSSSGFDDLTIWQAARATSAATTFFKPMSLGRDKVEYIDAAFGYNNPCAILIEEARRQFPNRGRELILSIGTGLGNVSSLKDSRSSIVKSLKKMAISSRKVALALDDEYADGTKGRYFRFNVERGLEDVSLSEWDKVGIISAHTKNYLAENRIRRQINELVHCLTGPIKEDTLNIAPTKTSPRVANAAERPNVGVFHHIPFPKKKIFVGREKTINDLLDMLFPLNEEEGQRVALFGLGGMGKTQTTLYLAHRVKENRENCSVIWIPALSRAGFKQACAEIVRILHLPGAVEPEESLRLHLTSQSSGDWLLIIDNADDVRMLEEDESSGRKGIFDYLPPPSRGRILFTTRSREVAVKAADSDFIQLLEMSPEEGKALLNRSLPQPVRLQDEGIAAELLERLTYLPLAIVQASAYMKTKDVPVSEYLRLCNSTSMDMINLLSSKLRDPALYLNDQRAVATTWIISFNQIQETDPLAADLLRFISWLEPKAIPRSILPEAEYEQLKTEAIGVLCQYGFLSRREDTDVFDMHSLAHLAAKEWNQVQDSSKSFQSQLSVVERLSRTLPLPEWTDQARFRLWERSWSHALHAFRSCHVLMNKSRARLGHLVGAHLLNNGFNNSATLEILDSVVSTYQALGIPPEDEWRLGAEYRIAIVLFRVERQDEALPIMAEVVKNMSNTLPEADPVLLSAQFWLARMFWFKGDVKAGVRILEDVVALSKSLPRSNLKRMERERYLADALVDDGQVERGLGILHELAMICAEELPNNHELTIDVDSSLSMIYLQNGDIERAIMSLERVVASRSDIRPPCHISRISSKLDLARAYIANGQLAESYRVLHSIGDEFVEEIDDSLLVREVQKVRAPLSAHQVKEILELATNGRLDSVRLQSGVPLNTNLGLGMSGPARRPT